MKRESLKLFFLIAVNEGYSVGSVDICAVFLQAKVLETEIFMWPPAKTLNIEFLDYCTIAL